MRYLPIYLLLLLLSCNQTGTENTTPADNAPTLEPERVSVIFDTDANNELDDQHALAYLLLNGNTFTVKGVTVNATPSGGDIEQHVLEAERILTLCTLEEVVPLLAGANGNFESIQNHVEQDSFDGIEAVDFIVEEARRHQDDPLTLIAVGKLTNVALALARAPDITEHLRVVWLGSNYPQPGEYNQDSDVPAMNYVLSTPVPFDMVTVRYGDRSGTDAVKVTQEFINSEMPGLGPRIAEPITGRHGGEYVTFGDYSVSLFEHIDYYNDAKERALFDLAAVAIVKNPSWAESRIHPCPVYANGSWEEREQNPRKITIWENFDREAIINDFQRILREYDLVATE